MNPILLFILVLAAIPLSYGALSLLSLTATGVWTFFASIWTSPGCFLAAALLLSAAIIFCAIHVWLKLDAPHNLSDWAEKLDSTLGDRLEYAATALALSLAALEGYMLVASPAAPTSLGLTAFVVFSGLGVGAFAALRIVVDLFETFQAELRYRRYLAQKDKQ